MLLAVTGSAAEIEIQKMLTSVHIEKWLQEDVFQFKWWLLLGLFTLTIALWWRMLNKARIPEILLYTVLTTIVMMSIDECGEELILWVYPIYLLPVFPVITAINLLFVSLVLSLTYQYFPTWKSFSSAAIIISGLLSFIFEPALAWADFYRLLNWNYGYSFLLYIAVALFIRGVVVLIFSIAENAQRHSS
ncbi:MULTISPECIES: hypothetical protein [Pelosinus]|jgi:hypothetical protein|uniref:Uncharacterized protein n=1 Tax=Pelosinus fermentans B4 TaxID=1149862 RepID=I9ATX4_9FIRM|nr:MULTISPECIES: hypothetical protein [Pelosinus]MDF2572001.1 hypothetical protein [Sporomusa sp.]EIW16392.1 hypothetical protein FB4_0903 [Pelosinus fermentans B4]EIW22627.1 hypothetical protein FA11_0210 [Pelosinus fermentans A11]OAM95699.1 hypothetical protein FR7_03720 [Pelosinus fermentans DSM 17108]SDR31731.1 hypothetical protein SAMN04515679_3862 [Pelosinus fermentans]